jgi:hypothetical protein
MSHRGEFKKRWCLVGLPFRRTFNLSDFRRRVTQRVGDIVAGFAINCCMMGFRDESETSRWNSGDVVESLNNIEFP